MKTISIILPTYNEAGNIVKLINAIVVEVKKLNLKPEIIVVDDNSPDNTHKVVKNLDNSAVKLLVRKNKRGLATAILHGLKKSTGDYIVLMDTDFNHQPKDIKRLLKPLLNQKADLVIGSRYIKGGGMHITEAGAFQFLASKYGSLLVSQVLLNLPVKESLSGFLVFNKKILKNLNLTQIFSGYGEYCIRLLFYLHQKNFKLAEISVVYGKRLYGQSKSRLVKMFINYLLTAIKLRFNNA